MIDILNTFEFIGSQRPIGRILCSATLEQHGSTYAQIFFLVVNTIVLCILYMYYVYACVWLVEFADGDSQVWKANCKIYSDFRLQGGSVPLTPALLKG